MANVDDILDEFIEWFNNNFVEPSEPYLFGTGDSEPVLSPASSFQTPVFRFFVRFFILYFPVRAPTFIEQTHQF